MKKALLFTITALCLVSCERKTDPGLWRQGKRFIFEGHTYIEFLRPGYGYDNCTGYVHDPDCPCQKED